FFCMLAIAVGAALLLTARRGWARFGCAAFTAASVGTLVLTITRSAMIATAVMLIFMTVVAGAWFRLASVVVVLVVGLLVALVIGVVPINAVGALANPHEASVQAHGSAVRDGLTLLAEDPLGRGLGTTGTIGQRAFGAAAITTENWYLQIAIELGI